jgi:polyferredoxin
VGNFFCGWVCPYGAIQDFFGSSGKKIFKKRLKMPVGIQKYLQYTRYALFAISLTGLASLFFEIINGYGAFQGIWMNGFVMSTAIIFMGSLLLIAIVFERPFCNYLCGEAVKYGVLSMTRIFSIKRNEDTCISCRKCDKACPMNIQVSTKEQVRNGQCINCFQCISACPVNSTLSFSRVKLPFKRKNKNPEDTKNT